MPIVSPMDQMVALMHASINALNTLHGGVTTVRDCGAPHQIDFALRRAAEEGLCLTPRLLLSGRALCMTGGHGWHLLGREVDGADQVRRAAREQIKAGADNVKLIASGGILTPGTNIGNPQFTVAEMQAAVEEAHAAGKTANAHAHGAEGIKRAAAAGVDSIEHCYFIDREGIDMMLARSTVLVATSAAVRNVVSYGVAAGIPRILPRRQNPRSTPTCPDLRPPTRPASAWRWAPIPGCRSPAMAAISTSFSIWWRWDCRRRRRSGWLPWTVRDC